MIHRGVGKVSNVVRGPFIVTGENDVNIASNFTFVTQVNNWCQVIQHWRDGCSALYLVVPLKDWPEQSRTM